jgi:cell fate regulator YaaT (PSP1 superfamily)
MDINEKTPRPEGRPEGQSEGSKPRDGKRGGRNNHHHHRGGRNNRPKAPEGAEQNASAAVGETPAPEAQNREQNRQSDRRNQGDRGQQNRNKGNRPDRENARPEAASAEASKQEPREQTAQKSGEASGRRQPPATGRPQRNIHRAPAQADLPDMDNLLIEDTAAAKTAVPQPEDAPDAAELERILERDIFEPAREPIPEVLPEGKVVVAGIRFRPGGKTYFFDPGEHTCVAGKYAIVETARGLEFGEICMGNRMVDLSMVVLPLRPVVRVATEADVAHNKENREKENSAFRIGIEKIREHKLDMKLVSVQYTFDNSKLLFYFTSAGRVDFRELVKDLAGVFHIRIELRQIGIRDEARMIGGLGACGRPLCCTTFLSDFGQVSMKMAKEQNLSLNSTKISGCCGRLMCCLRYEYDTYAEEIKKTPAQGTFVNTPDGPGMVTEIFPLQGEVKVSLRNQNETIYKRYKREDVEVQTRAPRPAPADEQAPAETEPDTAE